MTAKTRTGKPTKRTERDARGPKTPPAKATAPKTSAANPLPKASVAPSQGTSARSPKLQVVKLEVTKSKSAKPQAPKPGATKLDRLAALLARREGATLEQMMVATGWQPHSVRGALAGSLKRRGLAVASEKVDGVRRYRTSGAR